MTQDSPSLFAQRRRLRPRRLSPAKVADIVGFIALVGGWLLLTGQIEARLPDGAGQGVRTAWWAVVAVISVWTFWKERQLKRLAEAELQSQSPTEMELPEGSIVRPIRATERESSVSRIMTPIAIHALLLFTLLRAKFEVDRYGPRIEGLGLTIGLAECGVVLLGSLLLGLAWRRLRPNIPTS
jgi:hypothetical protein